MFRHPLFTSLTRKMSCISKGRLDGKVAIVTASTEGIGFGIAKRFAEEGAQVIISSRKETNVEKAVKQLQAQNLKAFGMVCHVAKKEDRERLFKTVDSKFGGVDILVSNAGANPTVGYVLDCPEDAWDKIFEINVKTSYLLAKETLPYMRKRGHGSILFVSSIAGYQPIDMLGAYSVSKTALLGLTKAAAQQLASENINVNCIAPGIVPTKFSRALTENETSKDIILSRIPIGRFGSVDEVSGVAAFLVSEDANYITGETIVVAGGMASRL